MFKFLFLVVFAVSLVNCQFDHEFQLLEKDEAAAPENYISLEPLVRHRRQFFGGLSSSPGGGFNQQFGYRAPPVGGVSGWGSISQSGDSRGFTSPINYAGGADFKSPGGHGASLSALHVPGLGSQGTLGGNLNVLSTPKHKVDVFASHTKTFDPNFKEIGRGSTTGGVNYNHNSGVGVGLSGTHTPGAPNTGSLSATVPIYKNDRTSIGLTGQTNLQQGMKPQHNVGVSLTHEFK